MIPALSIIIGSYVVLRALEICLKPQSAFASKFSRVVMIVVALVVVAVAVAQTADIVFAASKLALPGSLR